MSEPVLTEAIGVIDGSNVDFTTPSPYYPGTLFSYLNGLLQRQSDEDGPIEMGDNRVRMRIAPRSTDTLHFYYDTEPPIGGGYYIPPTFMRCIELKPICISVLDLHPLMNGAENPIPENEPIMTASINLSPALESAIDLKPRMISAEEE